MEGLSGRVPADGAQKPGERSTTAGLGRPQGESGREAEGVQAGSAALTLPGLLATDPLVGVALVSGRGRLVRANQRFCRLVLSRDVGQAVGRDLADLSGTEWAHEGEAIFGRVLAESRPAIYRHIHEGQQVQCTIWPMSDANADDEPDSPAAVGSIGLGPVPGPTCFLVLAVAGESHEAGEGERFIVIESTWTHLGPLDPLTIRELEVLALIGHGMSTRDIADMLHRSPRTIERHCDSIHKKLRTTSRVQMADFARRAGLTLDDARLKRV